MSKLSVIVPCYNEEAAAGRFLQETGRVLEQMTREEERKKREFSYEILFVDDGSSDGTAEVLRKLAEENDRVRYVIFSRNFGKEAAMYAGLQEAEGDLCVIMDADLQHPPALLPEMYRMITEEGYDCCGGKRQGREGDSVIRKTLSEMFYRVYWGLTGMKTERGCGDFRMMKRQVAEAILSMKERNRYMKGIFSFVGFHTCWIPYENVERTAGVSKWNICRLFRYAADGILAFSTLPLKTAGFLAAFLLLGGLLCLFPGKNPAVGIVLLAAGLQMGYLQILGSYLARDCMENRHRPVYIIREKG
ncbi:MAG: glycosyltransferase family 2 protein [Anaerovoracaceae bacterium]|nr:glycosyltransferase family 2 protein [Anaerovoracaceae bacterium]